MFGPKPQTEDPKLGLVKGRGQYVVIGEDIWKPQIYARCRTLKGAERWRIQCCGGPEGIAIIYMRLVAMPGRRPRKRP